MNSSESPETDNPWRRVSPISLCYFAFSAARQAINLWPALIALWAGGENIQQFFWQYGIVVLVIILLLSLWMHYWFFRFKEEDDRIQIRRGLLNRTRLTLYFERVQQADIIQPFYFRPFGLATLGLESAGSGQQEVNIPGIPYAAAQQLKKKILRFKKVEAGEDPAPEGSLPARSQPRYRLHLPPLEVARYGLMHNGLLFLLPVVGALSQQPGDYLQSLFISLQETLLFNTLIDFARDNQGWLIALEVIILLLAGIGVLFSLSVIIALLRFWNYTLVHRGDRFQYRAGLGTVKTRGFRLHKLQKVTISQGVIARLLHRYSVIVSKTGGAVQPGQELHSDAKRFMVPVLDKKNLREFLRQLQCPDSIESWSPISRFYIVWWSAWIGSIATGVAAIALSAFDRPLWLAMMVTAAIVAIVWRHWYCYGVFQNDDWFAVKTGFIGNRIVLIPSVKTQKITLSQPPWLRRQLLTHLFIWSGGGLVAVPHLPRAQATDIRDNLIAKVVKYRGRWF